MCSSMIFICCVSLSFSLAAEICKSDFQVCVFCRGLYYVTFVRPGDLNIHVVNNCVCVTGSWKTAREEEVKITREALLSRRIYRNIRVNYIYQSRAML